MATSRREALGSLWLADLRAGQTVREIAAKTGLSIWVIQSSVRKAKLAVQSPSQNIREPVLVPLFPITSFTPLSECPHKRPIPRGSSFVCMVCGQSGKDHYQALRLAPGERPPDPPAQSDDEPKQESRRARRAREHPPGCCV